MWRIAVLSRLDGRVLPVAAAPVSDDREHARGDAGDAAEEEEGGVGLGGVAPRLQILRVVDGDSNDRVALSVGGVATIEDGVDARVRPAVGVVRAAGDALQLDGICLYVVSVPSLLVVITTTGQG